MAIYTIYIGFTKFIEHNLYIYVFKFLLYTLSFCQGGYENIPILKNDDQNTKQIFASKGTQVAYQ
jgi:hypothetical protein